MLFAESAAIEFQNIHRLRRLFGAQQYTVHHYYIRYCWPLVPSKTELEPE